MKGKAVLLVAVAILVSVPGDARAQASRAGLIDAARNEFSDSAGMQLLVSALSPSLGEPDSLWAVAGYDLAATLLRNDQPELAALWLRWIARHGSAWPADPAWYPPAVVQAYQAARSAVDLAGDAASTTRWVWPDRFDPAAEGSVEASAADTGVGVSIGVEGRPPAPAGQALRLPPGTYTLVATAEGSGEARTTREVLPGATTVLGFDLGPVLTAAVQADVAARLVRITYMQGGRQLCGNGFLATADGLVLTTDRMIGDGTGFQIAAADGVTSLGSASIAATDPQRGLAVLRLGRSPGGQPIQRAAGAAADQTVWAVHGAGCTTTTAARTRLASWGGTGALDLSLPLPDDAAGAPIIDRAGMLLGIVRGSASMMPASASDDVLQRARGDVVTVQVPAPGGGGGFPWKWVGAGVAVAGVVGLVAGGGGGGGGDGPPPPTTGGITISFPN